MPPKRKSRPKPKPLSNTDIARIKADITRTLKPLMPTASSLAVTSLTSSLQAAGKLDHRIKGKLYEASVLAKLCEILHTQEGMTLKLVNGSHLVLNQKGGDVDHTKDPWIEVYDAQNLLIGEIWMNVEFLTLSHDVRSSQSGFTRTNSDYHELDIALIEPHNGRSAYKPTHEEVILGAECKCTKVTKDIVRSVLGLRRELSMLAPPPSSRPPWAVPPKGYFKSWTSDNSDPDSVLLLYSSSPMSIYNSLHNVYDIYMVSHKL
jgi:hypothetical protein